MCRSRASAARPGSSLGGNWLEAYWRSRPAVKCRPRPDSRIARTDGSAPSVRNASPIAANMSWSMALNLASRASSTWATPPSRPIAILSLPIFRSAPLETASMSRFTVNGQPVHYRMDPETPLLWALRDASNLTGTKYGCGTGHCGACTVHVDGRAVRSCRVRDRRPRGQLRHHHRGAVERPLAPRPAGLRRRRTCRNAAICIPGMIMAAAALIDRNPAPDRRRDRLRRSPTSAAAASIPGSARRSAAPAGCAAARAGSRPRRRRASTRPTPPGRCRRCATAAKP